ncbi:MAG: acyltransferase family protein [Candidatus Sulfotelmatobacter sp.]
MTESRNLDFLRSVAVLLVLVDHLFMAAGLAERFPVVYDMGRLGVLMFFVHTSLVLMLSLERSEERDSGDLFRGFYIRRAFRIYPLSIACVLLVCAFGVPQTPGGAPAVRSVFQIIASLLLVQNVAGQLSVISPMWSLPLEIQMYIVLPFLYIFARRHSAKDLLKVGCAAALIGLPFDWALSRHLVRGLGRLDILDYAPCFIAGVMSYRLSKNRTPAVSSWLWPVAVVATVTGYLLWQTVFPDPANRMPAYREWVVCWILGGLIPHFREMRLRWLRTASHYVAKYSYGIYLGQVPALWIGFTFWPHMASPFRWIVSVVLLAGIAVASYHAIEHPGILLGKLVAGRAESKRSRVAALVADN